MSYSEQIRNNIDLLETYISTLQNKGIDVLYHATYKPRLKSIMAHGLGAKGRKNWEDSKKGVVYLAINPDIAESYAESSDIVPDEWLDQIVILQINVSELQGSNIHLDQNVQDNEGGTVEYHGIIPPNAISIYKRIA